jgi:hypothetical protein
MPAFDCSSAEVLAETLSRADERERVRLRSTKQTKSLLDNSWSPRAITTMSKATNAISTMLE